MKILIFGGTGEARELANRLVALGHEVTTSLAGVTASPRLPAGDLHTDGFGGVEGLVAYLTNSGFDRLVDATHPFAAQISANAVAAARQAIVPLLRLERPAWVEQEGANWNHVASVRDAARVLHAGAHAFVTTGRKDIAPFLARTDCRFTLRMIEPPASALPAHAELILDRPPFPIEEEKALMRDQGITHLVSKNAGGEQTRAKLNAAAELGVQVVMIDRPELPNAQTVATIDEVLAALQVPTS